MQGEERAWELLTACDPGDVGPRAVAEWSPEKGVYVLAVFGLPIIVDPTARTITGSSNDSESMLTKAAYFSRLSILHYLAGAQKLPPAERLVKPEQLKSGQFFQGSHALPLGKVAERFGNDPGGFVKQAARFGGVARPYGDVGVELHPFPRIPVTLILWLEDEEFPAKCDLLFDATVDQHAPTDIVWSVAMLSVWMMLRP